MTDSDFLDSSDFVDYVNTKSEELRRKLISYFNELMMSSFEELRIDENVGAQNYYTAVIGVTMLAFSSAAANCLASLFVQISPDNLKIKSRILSEFVNHFDENFEMCIRMIKEVSNT